MGDEDVAYTVTRRISDLLTGFIPVPTSFGLSDDDMDEISITAKSLVLDDLLTFSLLDPAAYRRPDYILGSYASFSAVLHYRVAHTLLQYSYIDEDDSPTDNLEDLAVLTVARQISEKAKVETGVEIHPLATIGRRFVIDHGGGTVIGETAEIGDDCYFLQAVVLGGRQIAGAASTRRHPIIGDTVKIAGGAHIFGPITVGDRVTIEAGAKISTDVPSDTVVKVVCSLQIFRPPQSISIFGVVANGANEFTVYGEGLRGLRPCLCKISKTYEALECAIDVICDTAERLSFRVNGALNDASMDQLVLSLEGSRSSGPVYITNVQAFRRKQWT